MTPTSPPPAVILAAEDDQLVLTLLEEGLREAGYDVVIARDGEEALKIVSERAAEIAGLVTDIRMGAGVDGWEVARQAREANPALSVVYVSGDSAGEWHARGVPHSTMIAKPYTSSQVVVALATQQNRSDV